MTSAPTNPNTPEDSRHVRLTLKPKAPVTGSVDGGWWPRSRELSAEVPALLAVLAVRLGRVESVSYNLDEWDPTPRKIRVDGSVVRLAGYRSQPPDTVDVIAALQRVTLLVVPPQTAPETAHAALMAAGRRGNTDDVEALLVAPAAGDDVAEQRWELEDGPVHVGL